MPNIRVSELAYDEDLLATLRFPRRSLKVTRGIGSGLARRADDPAGIIWAVTDRGPNLKVQLALDRFGLDAVAAHAPTPGAKVMPCPEIGPTIVELRVGQHRVRTRRIVELKDSRGRALSGLPPAGTDARAAEPAIDVTGAILPPDPGGADTEGLTLSPDGSFWVGDEYGPSLLHVDPNGSVLERWVPAGTEALFAGAHYPVRGVLPAIAARRRLNRGFEGLTFSADGRFLHLVFQSPLANPDEEAGRRARHVRLWTLDSASGALVAEHLYRLDKPRTFERDRDAGKVERADLKLCDIATLPSGDLIVLERASATAKLYRISLQPERALPPLWNDAATMPGIEQLSAADALTLPRVDKRLLFSTDDHPEIGPDLEGMAVLDARTLLLVNDNDFGVEGAATRFWRIDLADRIDRR